MKKIYILGSLNRDYVISAPYMPKVGETLIGSDFFTNFGGKGANQAVACAKLGGKTVMLGAVGDDGSSAEMIDNLASFGVDISAIKIVRDRSGGVALIILAEGDNRIVLDRGANVCLTAADVDSFLNDVSQGDIFLTQLENDIDIVGYALGIAKQKGMLTILNPAPADKRILRYLNSVDIIVPNKSESQLLTGEADVLRASATLGVAEVITTLGGDGYMYWSHIKSFAGDCPKVDAVDTTAAGDTFCGALAVGLSQGQRIEKALSFAARCASLACTRKGAQQSIPSLMEAEQWNG